MPNKGFISLIFTAALALPAQSQETIAQPPTDRQKAQKDSQLRKELRSAWDRWLREDVAWIITDDERRAFNGLGTDEEREQFVEQFWLRRDPTPDTVENEYKEEHYRRIAYANERFASGIPGWKTDRGRAYIRFGPPDEIDSHPSGGTYQRTPDEGGGTTSTYPFEQWRYRHLDNIGDNIVLEFVDTSMSGEYRLTGDPCDKDALSRVPGAAPTQAEQIGLSTQSARFQNTNGTTCGPAVGGTAQSSNEFDRIRLLADIEKAPAVKFKDLEAMEVSSRVTYNTLPVALQVDYVRVTDFSIIANITLQFENRDLGFQSKDGVEKSVINLFGRIYTMTHRPVNTFERTIEVSGPDALLQSLTQRKSVFQESVPLAPGKYKLHIVAKDTVSGNLSTSEIALDVPHFEEGRLAASSLIVADSLQKLPSRQIGAGMFAIGDLKVRPRVGGQFSHDEKLGLYMQAYSLTPDTATHKPAGKVSYAITKVGSEEKLFDFSEDLANLSNASPDHATIEKLLPLSLLTPGEYTLTITIQSGSQTLERRSRFTVMPRP